LRDELSGVEANLSSDSVDAVSATDIVKQGRHGHGDAGEVAFANAVGQGRTAAAVNGDTGGVDLVEVAAGPNRSRST
jgi:hypothetical protein